MNARHRRTLEAIFARPTPATLSWKDVEALFRALDAEVVERAGSRVHVLLNGAHTSFHRPHPRPEIGRLTIRDVRDFLTEAGVKL
jgi:hypothetical protein